MNSATEKASPPARSAAPTKQLLVRGGQVYEHEGDAHKPRIADILIEGGRIVAVGPGLEASSAEVIDATGHLIMPGMINAHYHSHDTLCRGLFEELPLEMWLLYTLPLGARRSKEEVRARTLVGAVESLRSGITTVQDMLGLVPLTDDYVDVVLSAYRDVGIRVVFSPMVTDQPPVNMVRYQEMLPRDVQDMLGTQAAPAATQLEFIESQFRRHPAGGTLHWAVAPFGPQRCTHGLLEGCAHLSEKYRLPVYTHVYETKAQRVIARDRYGQYGGSFISYLESAGLLNSRLNIVHSVWISRAEMDRMADAGAGIVLNHLSNLKLKSGIAPVADLRESGVRLGLGCDNCSGSDVQNVFQAMKLFCLFNAVSDPEPGIGLAREALRHATLGNARTAGLDDQLGAIRPGFRADMALIDLDDFAYLPFNSAARQLVYTETGRGIRDVLVEGRPVVRSGHVTTVDEQALRQEVRGLMKHFIADYEDLRKTRERAMSYMRAERRRVWDNDVGLDRFIARTR
jgi:cytosine/adenosine deaminase-related metal-dependent hydrolase